MTEFSPCDTCTTPEACSEDFKAARKNVQDIQDTDLDRLSFQARPVEIGFVLENLVDEQWVRNCDYDEDAIKGIVEA